MGKVYKTGFPKNANMKDGVSNTHTHTKEKEKTKTAVKPLET